MNQVLDVKNLSYAYGKNPVLEQVAFSVESGETLGVVGANGTGKSTLLRLLGGLLKGEGSIWIMGEELTKKSATALRQKLSFVFQNPDDQIFMPSVFENIAFGLEKMTKSDEEIAQRVDEALRIVDLDGFGGQNSHHLSLGQKKRVCLAAAIARRPDLYLFDEPTNELDPRGRRRFIETLNAMGTTKLLVSHDLNMIAETCDRVLVLGKRKVAAWGPTYEIMTQKKLMEDHLLEVPVYLENGYGSS